MFDSQSASDFGKAEYRRFLEGDKEAFRGIIEAYRANLIRFITGITHDPGQAEEIAEDSFLELVIHPDRYNFSVSLKTYLYSVARHKALSALRYFSRRTTLPLESCEPPEAENGHEKTLERKERDRILYSAMGHLKEDYRTALCLFYFENMNYADIGRVMKKNKKQIDNLLTRARAALRNELKKEGYDHEAY